MNDTEIEYLETALTNVNNELIVNSTFHSIDKEKREILEELELSQQITKDLLKRLDDYRYIDELLELQCGRYIRWINLKNPENLKLTNGGILCEIKIDDNIVLILKNNINRFFQINMEENLVFQRLSDQEKVILFALDYLEK